MGLSRDLSAYFLWCSLRVRTVGPETLPFTRGSKCHGRVSEALPSKLTGSVG